MARYVCPTCGTGERLFSVERVEVMYSIEVGRGRSVEYTGMENDVLHDSSAFEDVVFCRGCDGEFGLANLKKVREKQ